MRHPKQNFCGPRFARWECDPAFRVGSALERKHPPPILYNNLRMLDAENDLRPTELTEALHQAALKRATSSFW